MHILYYIVYIHVHDAVRDKAAIIVNIGSAAKHHTNYVAVRYNKYNSFFHS